VPRVAVTAGALLAAARIAASCTSYDAAPQPTVDDGGSTDASVQDTGTPDASSDADANAPVDSSFPEAGQPQPGNGTSLCVPGATDGAICDDFDGTGVGGGLANFWQGVPMGAAPVVDKATYVTAPSSLLGVSPFQKDDSFYAGVESNMNVVDGTTLTLDFDYAAEIDVGHTELVQVRFDDERDTARFLISPTETTVYFSTAYSDAGAGPSLKASLPVDTRAKWHHAHITLKFASSASGSASLAIDQGTAVSSAADVTFPASVKPSKTMVRIGNGPGVMSGPALVNIDNFYAHTF
jgi:hypothetical protein